MAKQPESEDVTSFVLAARDGGSLPDFEPGQHLPVELNVNGLRIGRSYSLSAGPNGSSYRISVKREPQGLASRALHDAVETGDVIAAGSPAGDFRLQPGSRPVVLLSAGVGVTPMASMLQALVERGDPRSVYFVHSARDGAHHALAAEMRAASARTNVRVHVAYSQPQPEDREGEDFDSHGRIDFPRIEALLGGDLDADYYLCGPLGFVAGLSADLEAAGVPAAQIASETF